MIAQDGEKVNLMPVAGGVRVLRPGQQRQP